MNQSRIIPGDNLKKWLNQQVGYVKLNKSYTHLNKNFECAAWWEESEVKTGIYPLTLRKHPYAPYHVELVTKYDAVVTDDFFPALWGGVAISREPYQPKNVGASRTVNQTFDIVDCIDRTGYSPGNDTDFYVNLEMIPDLLADAKINLMDYKNRLDLAYSDYLMGDDKHMSNSSMIGYYGGSIQALIKSMEILNRKNDGIVTATEYSKNNFVKNTEWAVSNHA